MRCVMLLLSLLAFPAVDAIACRCEQRPLAEYFNNADFVAVAPLKRVGRDGDDHVLEFELAAAPHKGKTPNGSNTVSVATAASTASCGVQPDVGGIYVLFAFADANAPDTLRIDSCSGSRVHISTKLDEPQGFVDVPARFVAQQLNAQTGLVALQAVAANAPDPSDPDNDSLIGLLDLKALAHGGFTRLYAAPSEAADTVADIHDWSTVRHREVGYEVNAAIVYARVDGWYRLQTSDGRYGWAAASDAGTWFPYPQLPIRRLAYLTEGFDGLLWPAAGAGNPLRLNVIGDNRRREYPVRVLETATIGGLPFFRVEVLTSDACSSGDSKVRGSGWVPAYRANGDTTVWYYSRGC